ncbi:unnamed protein product, partial [Scytosiphon promiscuus]
LQQVTADRIAQNFAGKNPRLSLARLGIDAFPAPLTSSARPVSHITILNVKHNALGLVPSELFLCLIQLEELDLSENCICYLPETIGLATGLRKLNLSDNRLRRVPDGLGLLDALEVLDITRNLLEGLPRAIGGWANLQRLDLANNLLEDIPPEATFLAKLEHVNLCGNPVKRMPLTIKRLQTKGELLRSKSRRQKLVRRALDVRGAVRAAFTDDCLQDRS